MDEIVLQKKKKKKNNKNNKEIKTNIQHKMDDASMATDDFCMENNNKSLVCTLFS